VIFSDATDSSQQKINLLILSRVPGLGPARIRALKRQFGTSNAIFHADERALAVIPGIGRKLARTITDFFRSPRNLDLARKSAERQLALLDRYNATLVTIDEASYPPLLKEIYDPPPYLFVRGDIQAAHSPCLSVVGTRQATLYGRKAVEHICRGLVTKGFTIVSGFAYGIDMAAHKATLDNGGKTIAILAGGVDNPHTDPAGKVWPRIIEEGAILSEEWLESTISPSKFPKRNRLISGISKGTVIVESKSRGGSLITASYALDQNREVFSVPGSIFSTTSAGPNALIEKSQAKLVNGAEDIIAELCSYPATPEKTIPDTPVRVPPTPEETIILDHFSEEPLHIDMLAEKTGIEPSELLVHLFEMELKNLIEQQPGQMFCKNS